MVIISTLDHAINVKTTVSYVNRTQNVQNVGRLTIFRLMEGVNSGLLIALKSIAGI